MEKTKRCCINKCDNLATTWKGLLIKSRDKVTAGFCDLHKDTVCPNAFGMKDVFGIYDKSLELINPNKDNNDILSRNTIEQ